MTTQPSSLVPSYHLFAAGYTYVYRPVPSGAADVGTAGRPRQTTRSCHYIMPTHAHRTRRNVDHWAGFVEKPTEKPTEKCWVSVSVFSFSFSKPTKLTDFFVRNRKTDQAISTFGSQPCVQNPGLAAFAQSPQSLLVCKVR